MLLVYSCSVSSARDVAAHLMSYIVMRGKRSEGRPDAVVRSYEVSESRQGKGADIVHRFYD